MGAWDQGWALGSSLAQQHQAHKQQLADTQRQQSIQQNQAASLGIAHVLTSGIHPDTGEALSPQEKIQLAQKNKELQAQLQDLWNPRQNVNQMGKAESTASGVAQPESAIHKVGDLLHITHPPAPGAKSPQQQMSDLRDITQKYQPQAGQPQAEAAQFELQSKIRGINTDKTLTPQDKEEAIRKLYGVNEKPALKLYTLSDGTRTWLDASRPDMIPEGAQATGAETSDTRKRADFSAFQKEHPEYKGTFEQWTKQQSSSPGYKFNTATGQVTEPATGKTYNQGDPNNPPEVAAMFTSANQVTAKKEAFQTKLAQMRAASYGQARQMAPLNVLDSANGNAPMYKTYLDMMKEPGRYVPAGEADKAIAKENLMQDIQGSSKIMRSAITNMKEDFPIDMKAKIALAMKADDPHAALDQLLASGALGTLTPDQQDVYVATQQLAEQGMAVRSLLGAGQGSDTMRSAMRSTLPSLLSPDRGFALKQLNAFDATIARLHRGVPNIKLNETGQAKKKVSLAKAMALPQNKGVPKAIVQKDIETAGFEVIP